MNTPLISKINITGLFDIYNYELPAKGSLQNAAILYGDNGVGKSTILRLAFHLLSAANDRGHRQALYAAEFNSLSITLSNGIILSAVQQPPSNDSGPKKLVLSIQKGRKKIAGWDFIPKSIRRESDYYVEYSEEKNIYIQKSLTVKLEKFNSERQYLEVLAECVPNMFILNADRRLDSDSVPDPSDEVELRRVMRYEEAKRVNDLVARSREIALTQALSSAAKWISRKALQSTNKGSENVHGVYSQVLKHLVGHSSTTMIPPETPDSTLQEKLSEIEVKTKEFAAYEFATPLTTTEFQKAITTKNDSKRQLAINLLTPYIDSLESRLAAIDPIYKVVDKFINVVNNLLVDKKIYYKVSQGFSIYNLKNHLLEPGNLSSGEQQLLLLFCYVLTGRDKPCVFMIDEPEISLNVKWQRQLIQSLLDITSGSEIQFIFASHSMELLSQHRSRVVKLERGYE